PLNKIVTPYQKTTARGSQNLISYISLYPFNLESLKREIESLKVDKSHLETEISNLKKMEEENQILRDELGFKEKSFEVIGAETLGFVPEVSGKILIIDKGKKDGIKEESLVTLKNILLGKIVRVEENTSLVRLLSDPESKIPVETQTGTKGIILGQFSSTLKLEKVLPEEPLQKDELVLTSGESGTIKGLAVGKVDEIKALSLFKEATVTPLVSYDKLKIVFVLK
ncbi:MAG: hypothetical protein A2Y57_04070, partial [Candidatus Woykebacteria bacterium RBG_13_40_7b]